MDATLLSGIKMFIAVIVGFASAVAVGGCMNLRETRRANNK